MSPLTASSGRRLEVRAPFLPAPRPYRPGLGHQHRPPPGLSGENRRGSAPHTCLPASLSGARSSGQRPRGHRAAPRTPELRRAASPPPSAPLRRQQTAPPGQLRRGKRKRPETSRQSGRNRETERTVRGRGRLTFPPPSPRLQSPEDRTGTPPRLPGRRYRTRPVLRRRVALGEGRGARNRWADRCGQETRSTPNLIGSIASGARP